MRKFRDLTEAKDTIVFAFGRFNPPTTGHEKLIQKVASVAGSNPYRIYPSFTQNPKKDPLPHSVKTAYMRKMFRKYAKNIIVDKDAKTAIMIAEKLYKEGYKNLIMVAGSDRVKEFSTLLNRYNDAPDQKGNQLFKFDTVNVVSAGERDPDSEGVEGMSASKMRAAASDGDVDSFLQGVPSGFADGKKLYRDVRKYMGIREDRDMGDMTDFETLRDAYLTGQIWNVGEIIEAKGLTGEVVRKGTNYLSFMTEDGKVHKAWLHEINEIRSSRPRAGGPKSIERNIKKHIELMKKYMKQGMSKEEASKKAYKEIVKEEVELDELWFDNVKAKLDQITHPKGYGKMVQDYAELLKQDKFKKRPNMAADEVARENSKRTREFIKYINKLVAKKVLPQELKAEYEIEDTNMFTFREFDEQTRVAPLTRVAPGTRQAPKSEDKLSERRTDLDDFASGRVSRLLGKRGQEKPKKKPEDDFGRIVGPSPKKKPDTAPVPKAETKPSAPEKPAVKPKAETKPSAPEKKDTQSFGQAFAAARKKAGGPSGTFTWQGKKYNTRRADDPKPSKSKPDSPKKMTVPKSDAPVPSMPKVPVGKVKSKPLTPPSSKQPAKHDVSTREGRRAWYKARVERARKAGHPNPNMYASQAALETGWGKSKSAKGNLVGMKARKGQAGETKGTTEYVKGKKIKTTGTFAQFGSEAGGIAQHGKEWKGGLTKSGGRKYATDPDYEKKIAAIRKMYDAKPKPITASFDVNEDQVVSRKVSDTGVVTKTYKSGQTQTSDASGRVRRDATGKVISRETPRLGGMKIRTDASGKKTRDFRGKIGGANVALKVGGGRKELTARQGGMRVSQKHDSGTGRAQATVGYKPAGRSTTMKMQRGKVTSLSSKGGGMLRPADKSKIQSKIAREDMTFKDFVNQIQERELTNTEVKRKEEVVKSMKKKLPEFEKNYGKDAKSVMYATATKMAKKES